VLAAVQYQRLVPLAALVILTAALALPATAGDIVAIHLPGRYYVAPATVDISVMVEPNAANRVLRVEADGDQMYRSTEIELSGASDHREHLVEFKNLEPGTYHVRAVVLSTTQVRGMAVSDMMVTGQ
jgi:hypothetical protein